MQLCCYIPSKKHIEFPIHAGRRTAMTYMHYCIFGDVDWVHYGWSCKYLSTYPSPFVQQHTTEFLTQTLGSPGDQRNFTGHGADKTDHTQNRTPLVMPSRGCPADIGEWPSTWSQEVQWRGLETPEKLLQRKVGAVITRIFQCTGKIFCVEFQRYLSFNVWVRYFVSNFKGYLWNFTQNILPIHVNWKYWRGSLLLTWLNFNVRMDKW